MQHSSSTTMKRPAIQRSMMPLHDEWNRSVMTLIKEQDRDAVAADPNDLLHIEEDDDEDYEDIDDDDDNDCDYAKDGDGESSEVYRCQEDGLQGIQLLLRNETRLVNTWRWILTLLLILAGIAFALSTYVISLSYKNDYDVLETKQEIFATYEILVASMSDASASHAVAIADAFQAMASLVTGTAQAQHEVFPFVTVPSFDATGRILRQTTGVSDFWYAPWVADSLFSQWRDYVSTRYTDNNIFTQNVTTQSRIIDSTKVEAGLDSAFAPVWHQSPPLNHTGTSLPPESFNYNLFSDPAIVHWAKSVSSNHENVLSEVALVYPLSVPSSTNTVELPTSTFVQPVLDADNGDVNNNTNNNIVGMIVGVVPWHAVLKRILPNGLHGVNLILHDRCPVGNSEQVWSYRVENDPDHPIVYLGKGDLHDSAFDHTERIIVLSTLAADTDTSCTHSIAVYASHAFYDARQHILSSSSNTTPDENTDPWVFCGIAITVFLLLLLTWTVYNRFVAQRNMKLMQAAAQYSSMIANIYPSSHIRHRLLMEQHPQPQQVPLQPQTSHHSETLNALFFRDKKNINNNNDDNISNSNNNNPPGDKTSAETYTEDSYELPGLPNTNTTAPAGKPTTSKNRRGSMTGILPVSRLKRYLTTGDYTERGDDDDEDDDGLDGSGSAKELAIMTSKPIAELFPHTTVMFGDIAGFTAWSSVREPSQVFTLLETLYHAFDEAARRRKVFKVETIGDCYVAVTGLPDPQNDHAVIMARFAMECVQQVRKLTKKLEMSLGPDTADLEMRVGLHSGPVTAGVLRGERARFQLFGDTMNTAARMESTGKTDRVQVSQETADLLVAAGKKEWVKKREDRVVAKGKGELQTFWLQEKGDRGGFLPGSPVKASRTVVISSAAQLRSRNLLVCIDSNPFQDKFDSRTNRLIDWNTDVLIKLLKQIVARRGTSTSSTSVHAEPAQAASHGSATVPDERRFRQQSSSLSEGSSSMILDEVKEIIDLPSFNPHTAVHHHKDPERVELDRDVRTQLHLYVSHIANMYRNNDFHNFEHASHVVMSVNKLLSRIVAPFEYVVDDADPDGKKMVASTLHDHTYGITSDPLTQFACVFSALIHDCDHNGVPNAQLVKEQSPLAALYQNKSVAEQNSVALAWNLLMENDYKDLRAVIYTTDDELRRFRQLVVNSVMATDVVDKELKALRNARWERAFSQTDSSHESEQDVINRKATIVIEHLIQASDVSHTMQHWHIYRKWNERFFQECYKAYEEGRAEKNPADGWYEGELGFFDFYIIPLSKKLKDCGVFGVSSDEYLNYASRNRKEWEERGREVVNEMVERWKNRDQE